jgi:hypothetical protein
MTLDAHPWAPHLTRRFSGGHRWAPHLTVAPSARARVREAVPTLDHRVAVALGLGVLAMLVGLAALLLANPDGVRQAFIGAGLTAAGVLTLCVGASVQTDISRRAGW